MNAWFKDLDGNIVGVISVGRDGPQLDPGAAITAMIAASDLDRAKRWYADKLGFEPAFEFPDVLATYKSGPSTFTVYKTEFAGTAQNTVGVWRLEGIRAEVERLRGRGVVFEDYDFGDGDTTVDGIMADDEGDANAWFKDSEGNILALAEDRGEVI
jgi:catechol 2,3-dioxygenase-like lactoylglutathione lyase family enzyme